MPPSLCRGRCIRYSETRTSKKPYAVVLEIGNEYAVIARGTSREHPRDYLIVEVDKGEKGSNAWNPPLSTMTRFYTFDIRKVELGALDGADLGGFCRQDIFDRLAEAMQRKIFVGGPNGSMDDETP